MRALAAVFLTLMLTGCATTLPPGVHWFKIEPVEAVDLFYRTSDNVCWIRIIWWRGDTPVGFTAVLAEPTLCEEREKHP